MDQRPENAFTTDFDPLLARRRRAGRRTARSALRPLLALGGLSLFGLAVYLSGSLGIAMAKKRTAPAVAPLAAVAPAPAGSIRVGSPNDPLYLAHSADSLRRFYSAHPTAFERARTDLSGSGIRRLQDSLELLPIRIDADAVEVRITSGAIAGASYWIHHTQLPPSAKVDPIVAPVPGSGLRP